MFVGTLKKPMIEATIRPKCCSPNELVQSWGCVGHILIKLSLKLKRGKGGRSVKELNSSFAGGKGSQNLRGFGWLTANVCKAQIWKVNLQEGTCRGPPPTFKLFFPVCWQSPNFNMTWAFFFLLQNRHCVQISSEHLKVRGFKSSQNAIFHFCLCSLLFVPMNKQLVAAL